MFSFLKKNSQDEINSYGNSSVYLSSGTEYENTQYLKKDDKYPEFEIYFVAELSDGTLVFDILDSNSNKAGHVVSPAKATDREKIQIIESIFYEEFTKADRDHLKDHVLKFCSVRC